MVIVQGTFRVDPARRDEYLAQSFDGMRASREDRGCLEYTLAADPLEPDRVILSERWASKDDLDEHLRASGERRAAAAASADAPTPIPVLEREIAIYHIESVEPLG